MTRVAGAASGRHNVEVDDCVDLVVQLDRHLVRAQGLDRVAEHDAPLVDRLVDAAGESVDKRTVVIGNPIKSLGAHQVSVRLHDEVSATVALNVVPA
jgi:hypothetical protein